MFWKPQPLSVTGIVWLHTLLLLRTSNLLNKPDAHRVLTPVNINDSLMIDSRTVKINLGNVLPTLSKTAVATILGLATLVITFAISVAALDRTERLDYESIANSLIFSVVAALFLFVLAQWYSPF